MTDLWDSVTTPVIFDRPAVAGWLRARRSGNHPSSVDELAAWLVS